MRDYDAVELGLDKRLSGHWSARVSYTWSRLYGNYSGLAQSDEDGARRAQLRPQLRLPADVVRRAGEPVYGVLATDRRTS